MIACGSVRFRLFRFACRDAPDGDVRLVIASGRRDRVVAPRAAGVTTPQPPRGEPDAPPRPVAIDGFVCVLRTCGLIPARRPRLHGDRPLVEADSRQHQPLQDRSSVLASASATVSAIAARSSSKLASTMRGWAEISTSKPPSGGVARMSSRSRRRTRLRTTAPPTRRLTANPQRTWPRPLRRTRTVKSRCRRALPRRESASKSEARRNDSSDGRGIDVSGRAGASAAEGMARTAAVTRPRGACARVHAAAG